MRPCSCSLVLALAALLGAARGAEAGPSFDLFVELRFDPFPLTQALWHSDQVEAEPPISVTNPRDPGPELRWEAEFRVRPAMSLETREQRIAGTLEIGPVPDACERVFYQTERRARVGYVAVGEPVRAYWHEPAAVSEPIVTSDGDVVWRPYDPAQNSLVTRIRDDSPRMLCGRYRQIGCAGQQDRIFPGFRSPMSCEEFLAYCDRGDAQQRARIEQLMAAMPEPAAGWPSDRPKGAGCHVRIVAAADGEDALLLRAVDINGAEWGRATVERADVPLAGWKRAALTPISVVGDLGWMTVQLVRNGLAIVWNGAIFVVILPLIVVASCAG